MPPKRKKDASRDVDDGAPPAKQQRRNKKDVEAEPKADSDEKAPRDNIDWQANDWYNTWALLTCMERAENQKLIVGVRKGQKTAGENKKDAYNRMAEELFPNLYAKDKTGVSKRVKSQVEKLVKNYRLHAAKLRVTGGGIDAVEDDDDDFDDDKENDEPTSASDKHIMMKFYIGENGPTADTPLEGCNLWESITNEFRFFPRMHTMFSTRPNINPPAVVTGVGPAGASTTFYQPPPASLGLSAPAPTSTSAPSSPFCGLSLPSPALSRQNSSNLDNTNDLDPFVHQVMATQAGADNQNDMEMNDDEFSQFLRSLPGYDSDFSGDGLDMFHRTSMEWGTTRDTSMYTTPDPTPRVASSFSFPFHEQPLPQTPTPGELLLGLALCRYVIYPSLNSCTKRNSRTESRTTGYCCETEVYFEAYVSWREEGCRSTESPSESTY
ncbi:hypothetical protein BDZ89DRAFT_1119495 [Hymenopellis radicata]|nr:hypothetical protein BDZ89DRAFT_1119495 [Hymenopellis radicata]